MSLPDIDEVGTVDDAAAGLLTDLANAGRSHRTVRAYRRPIDQRDTEC